MKKLILIIVLFVSTLAIAFGAYVYWSKSTFVAREIKRRTGAEKIHVLAQVHAADHWYGKAEIDQQTGEQILDRFQWEHGFDKKVALAGRIVSDVPPDCPTCFYRIESSSHDRQYHPYDYTLYVLSADQKVLEVYEQFGS